MTESTKETIARSLDETLEKIDLSKTMVQHRVIDDGQESKMYGYQVIDEFIQGGKYQELHRYMQKQLYSLNSDNLIEAVRKSTEIYKKILNNQEFEKFEENDEILDLEKRNEMIIKEIMNLKANSLANVYAGVMDRVFEIKGLDSNLKAYVEKLRDTANR